MPARPPSIARSALMAAADCLEQMVAAVAGEDGAPDNALAVIAMLDAARDNEFDGRSLLPVAGSGRRPAALPAAAAARRAPKPAPRRACPRSCSTTWCAWWAS